ncbi:hypothetical protein AMJ57_05735 [Parcubacteria bacterium SG8_24]|nr:MAG: hypothetical protein AMJ57_05735 [Parcubacteria bacterium SG8_24]
MSARGRVVKNTAYLVSAFVGQKVLSFIYFTVIARTVGVEGAGRYFVAVSFTTLFSVFVDLGLANVLVREVAKFPDKARQLPEETVLMISVASVVMVLDSLHLIIYAVMRGFQNLRYEAIGVVSGQAATIIVGSIFLFLRLPLPFLVGALLCGSTWNVIWAWFSMVRHFGVIPSVRYDRTVIRFFWRVTVPFALAGIFSRVYSYIDSIMISKLISEAAVGLYSVAYKIAFAFQFIPMAFAAAIYPAMSEYFVSDRRKLRLVFTAAQIYLLLIVVPLAFGIAVLAEPFVVMIYGDAFRGSVLPLQILIFSLVFAFLYWPSGSLLNACDRQVKNTTVMGVTMLANVLLNAVLIPRLSVVGAAIAALLGNFILWSGALIFATRVAPPDIGKLLRASSKITLSAGVMGLTLYLLRPHLHALLLVPLGVLLYVALVLSTRGVTVSELRGIASIFLRRGKGVSDIVS